MPTNNPVTLVKNIHFDALEKLLHRYDMTLIKIPDNQDIPGSYWGEPEAGIIENKAYVRDDTPVHSLLHESCHYICMDSKRRIALDTNAEGDYDEENAVCYLQILLSDQIDNYSQSQMMKDMDNWGYTFRLGSSKNWFTQDAEDAKQWLIENTVINQDQTITYQLRQ